VLAVLVVSCLVIALVWFIVTWLVPIARDLGIPSTWPPDQPNPTAPHIVHLMWFPWDRCQRLLDDPNAFDHGYFWKLEQEYPEMRIMMWTLPLVRNLVQKHYPGVWDAAWLSASRPTQLVDLFRWLVVYHYGGVYLQYGTTLRLHPRRLLPMRDHGVRLFTEFVWFTPGMRRGPAERFVIRNGEPEEKIRVMNQVFSATPHHQYIKLTWQSILERMQRIKPKCDYDILYIGANAFVSELYDRLGQHRSDIELLNFFQSRSMVAVPGSGSWRTDPDFVRG
jgi:hypothetical protein